MNLSILLSRQWEARHGRRRGHLALRLICCGILASLAACAPREPPEPTLLHSHTAVPVSRLESVEFPLPEAPGPLLVEILGTGTGLDTRLILPDNRVLSRVHFEYLRSVPIYHYLDPADADGSPRLQIIPLQAPANAKATINFYHLPRADLAEAWRSLARGQNHIDTMEEGAWSENLTALEAARDRFERLGMQHPALWAAYLRAYLLYFPLYRYDEASAGARRILDTIGAMERPEHPDNGLSTIEVLAHQLAGQILLESGAGGLGEAGVSPLATAREHFTAARDLAAANNLPFEETWAINNLGIAFFYGDQLDDALEQYAGALQRAEAARDSYLVALVGANVAVAQERLGYIDKAVQTLERIRREPTMQDSPMEREYLPSLLGAFYLKLYRFPEALRALDEALHWSDRLGSSENRGRNRVMLGRAYREMGQPAKALTYAELAVPDLEAVQDARGLRQAHRLLADLHRLQGDSDAMQRERELQMKSQPLDTDLDRADWLFSRAEDASAQGEWPTAAGRFRESSTAYEAAGFTTSAGIARLHACAAETEAHPPKPCSIEALRPLYGRIETLQAFAPALRARFAWVRLLAAQGHRDLALREAESLVYDIHFYRKVLPGILGAWYWDAREAVFTFYLQLRLDGPGEIKDSRPDVLLALDRLRNSGSHAQHSTGSLPADPTAPSDELEVPPVDSRTAATHSLRTLLAKRDRANSPAEQMEVQRLIDLELATRKPPANPAEETGTAGLIEGLKRLGPDWSLLAYYVAGSTALAWVGDSNGLELVDLGPAEPVLEQIERVKTGLRVYNEPALETDLVKLGRLLLQPVQPKLRFNVMLATGGALSDLPMDALMVDRRSFIEDHQVMHIQSVRSVDRSAQRAAEPLRPQRLFLAGDPDFATGSLNALPGTQRELEAIHAAFPAAESDVFTGRILTAETFRQGAVTSADLVHIASHGVIDRDYPELSRLMVSNGSDAMPAYVTPADLEGIALSARLVVLSACETVGLNRFDFDNRLGFVTQLLQQSGTLVIASLWPVPDRMTGQFMAYFYGELAATGNVPAALRAAKLQLLATSGSNDQAWAAFQLFSR